MAADVGDVWHGFEKSDHFVVMNGVDFRIFHSFDHQMCRFMFEKAFDAEDDIIRTAEMFRYLVAVLEIKLPEKSGLHIIDVVGIFSVIQKDLPACHLPLLSMTEESASTSLAFSGYSLSDSSQAISKAVFIFYF